MIEIIQDKINIFNQLAESYNIKVNENSDAEKNISIFDIFKTADEDSNGIIEGSEIINLYDDFGLIYGQSDELNKLIEEFNRLNEELDIETLSLNETQAEKNNKQTNNSISKSNYNSSKSYSSKNRCNNIFENNCGSDNSQTEETKDLENMTLEELKNEQNLKQSKMNDAQEKLNEVYSGENSAIKTAIQNEENAQIVYENLLENLLQQGVISNELKEDRKINLEEIKAQEEIINTTKININDKKNEIISEEDNLNSAKSNLSALKNALSSYENASNNNDNDFSSKKTTLENKIREEEENIKKIEDNINKLENEKEKLESNLAEQEAILENFKTESIIIDEKIIDACQNSVPEIKIALQKAQQDCNLADIYVDKIKLDEENNAKAFLETTKESLNVVNEAYNKKNSSSIIDEYGNNISEMKDIVSYFGEEYLSVLSQEEINSLIQKAKKNNMANIYPGMGSQCLGICYEYEKWVTGLSGRNNPYESENVDTTIQKMVEVLNSGSPVIAKVNTKAGTRHFVLVIGIKKGASAPYQQSDFLCVDSYDGQVDGMGSSGNIDGNYRTLYSQNGKYWIGSRATTFV